LEKGSEQESEMLKIKQMEAMSVNMK